MMRRSLGLVSSGRLLSSAASSRRYRRPGTIVEIIE